MCAAAQAQEVDRFYEDHDITMVVGFNTGGAYDLYARTLARHMAKHIPGSPNIIVQNMPGAGSVIAANHLYNQSPKDGSEIGLVAGTAALDPLFGLVPTEFDARKLNWLGSAEESVGVCFAWHESNIKTAQDLFDQEMITGTAGTSSRMMPLALNSIIGTKLKLISGYAGTAGIMLALEQREVDGACGMIYSAVQAERPNWLEDDLVRVVLQFGLNPSDRLGDVPSASEFAKTDEQKQLLELMVGWSIMGRPFVAPPGLPEERVELLRKAFAETMKDPEFLADAAQQRLDVSPVTGEHINEFLDRAYSTPPELIAKVRDIYAEGQ
jgi:tripartite-type tricarboxylate transporter receptor subunit TctC